jgi:polyphosphate kinase
MYMASADWMNRNLNRRIELCFPVYDKNIKNEVIKILKLQLSDNTKARILDKDHRNLPRAFDGGEKIRAQIETYHFLKT